MHQYELADPVVTLGKKSSSFVTAVRKVCTGVEWVEISQKNFVPFFGPRMFLRS